MSLFKRSSLSNANYHYKFMLYGRPFEASTKTSNRKLAQQVEERARRDAERASLGIVLTDVSAPFDACADAWLERARLNVSTSTYEAYTVVLKRLTRLIGHAPLRSITPTRFESVQQQLVDDGYAASTVANTTLILSMLLASHGLWEGMRKRVRKVKANPRIGHALTKDEATALLTACRASDSRSMYMMVYIGLHTALRLSEIRLLRWKHYDAERQLIRGGIKSKAGRDRVVFLSSSFVATLAAWRAQLPSSRPTDFIVPRLVTVGHNHAFDPTQCRSDNTQTFKAICQRAGLPGFTFHQLRHTAITWMLESGVSLAVITKIVGWSPKVAADMIVVYGHIADAYLRDAFALLGSRVDEVVAKIETSPRDSA